MATTGQMDPSNTDTLLQLLQGGGPVDPAMPRYLQIAEQILRAIDAQRLPVGSRLPSTRDLATAFGVNRNTTVRTYAYLRELGMISAHVGRGTFVTAAHPPTKPQPTDTYLSGQPPGRRPPPTADKSLDRLWRLSRGPIPANSLNLAKMEASSDLFPAAPFQESLQRVMSDPGHESLGYAPAEGVTRLRYAIAADLQRHGIQAHPDLIFITSGSQQALNLVAMATLRPGDLLAVEDRTYSGALHAFASAGARWLPLACDDSGPLPFSPSSPVPPPDSPPPKALYLLSQSARFAGTPLASSRRPGLLSWAEGHGATIIEDSHGLDLNLDGHPLVPLRALSEDSILIGSFSKTLFPALRVGYIVCPPTLRPALTRLKHVMDLSTSTLLQHALADYLERGLYPDHLQTIRAVYRQRRDTLIAALQSHMPAEVRWTTPQTGLALWLELPPQLDAEQIFHLAKRQGVLVSPGTLYSPQPDRQNPSIRLTFSAEKEDALYEAAVRLSQIIKLEWMRHHETHRLSLRGV